MRDWQKARVYAAERAAEALVGDENPHLTAQDARDICIRVCRDAEVSGCRVTICAEPRKGFLAEYGINEVILYPGGMRTTVLLHELAHHVEMVRGRYAFPDHSAEWALTYLRMIGRYLGDEVAAAFTQEFERRDVHFSPEVRAARVRRVAVNMANSGGKWVEVALDDPPKHVAGFLSQANRDILVVNDKVYPMRKARYIEGVS